LAGDWDQVANAYNNSPLGQTVGYENDCDPFNKYAGYYGTRGLLALSAVSAVATVPVGVWTGLSPSARLAVVNAIVNALTGEGDPLPPGPVRPLPMPPKIEGPRIPGPGR
jgi:hypothetical protein